MTRHARTEPIRHDRHLLIAVTQRCFTRADVLSNGQPRLVIDYGGAALVLDVIDPWDAEAFAFGMARASLDFAEMCRQLMGDVSA
jgi:hypothetical protein